MASQLDICNMALSNIGANLMTSLSDGNATARLVLLNWDRCLTAVLREYPWGFATKVAKLSLLNPKGTLNGYETEGYAYSYAYPDDCLKMWEVKDDHRKADYEIRYDGVRKTIVTNAEDAAAKYTVLVNDTSLYDASFVDALIFKLAYELNNAKTGNAQQTAEMKQRYIEALAKACHDEATESREHNLYPRHYIDSRR